MCARVFLIKCTPITLMLPRSIALGEGKLLHVKAASIHFCQVLQQRVEAC